MNNWQAIIQDNDQAICKAKVNIKLLNLDCLLYHVFPKQTITCELYSSQYIPSYYRPVAGNVRGLCPGLFLWDSEDPISYFRLIRLGLPGSYKRVVSVTADR